MSDYSDIQQSIFNNYNNLPTDQQTPFALQEAMQQIEILNSLNLPNVSSPQQQQFDSQALSGYNPTLQNPGPTTAAGIAGNAVNAIQGAGNSASQAVSKASSDFLSKISDTMKIYGQDIIGVIIGFIVLIGAFFLLARK